MVDHGRSKGVNLNSLDIKYGNITKITVQQAKSEEEKGLKISAKEATVILEKKDYDVFISKYKNAISESTNKSLIKKASGFNKIKKKQDRLVLEKKKVGFLLRSPSDEKIAQRIRDYAPAGSSLDQAKGSKHNGMPLEVKDFLKALNKAYLDEKDIVNIVDRGRANPSRLEAVARWASLDLSPAKKSIDSGVVVDSTPSLSDSASVVGVSAKVIPKHVKVSSSSTVPVYAAVNKKMQKLPLVEMVNEMQEEWEKVSNGGGKIKIFFDFDRTLTRIHSFCGGEGTLDAQGTLKWTGSKKSKILDKINANAEEKYILKENINIATYDQLKKIFDNLSDQEKSIVRVASGVKINFDNNRFSFRKDALGNSAYNPPVTGESSGEGTSFKPMSENAKKATAIIYNILGGGEDFLNIIKVMKQVRESNNDYVEIYINSNSSEQDIDRFVRWNSMLEIKGGQFTFLDKATIKARDISNDYKKRMEKGRSVPKSEMVVAHMGSKDFLIFADDEDKHIKEVSDVLGKKTELDSKKALYFQADPPFSTQTGKDNFLKIKNSFLSKLQEIYHNSHDSQNQNVDNGDKLVYETFDSLDSLHSQAPLYENVLVNVKQPSPIDSYDDGQTHATLSSLNIPQTPIQSNMPLMPHPQQINKQNSPTLVSMPPPLARSQQSSRPMQAQRLDRSSPSVVRTAEQSRPMPATKPQVALKPKPSFTPAGASTFNALNGQRQEEVMVKKDSTPVKPKPQDNSSLSSNSSLEVAGMARDVTKDVAQRKTPMARPRPQRSNDSPQPIANKIAGSPVAIKPKPSITPAAASSFNALNGQRQGETIQLNSANITGKKGKNIFRR